VALLLDFFLAQGLSVAHTQQFVAQNYHKKWQNSCANGNFFEKSSFFANQIAENGKNST
jgi:hypothetical protein